MRFSPIPQKKAFQYPFVALGAYPGPVQETWHIFLGYSIFVCQTDFVKGAGNALAQAQAILGAPKNASDSTSTDENVLS